ncbi:MAG TPA: winged helix-turn-helix transcriptional regulator [Coleofasciculaceae cyanobacterium]
MSIIHIIQATPGPTTSERILELLQEHSQGLTIKELCNTLNRPVSMVQRCLKILMASGQVYARWDDDGTRLIYYSASTV